MRRATCSALVHTNFFSNIFRVSWNCTKNLCEEWQTADAIGEQKRFSSQLFDQCHAWLFARLCCSATLSYRMCHRKYTFSSKHCWERNKDTSKILIYLFYEGQTLFGSIIAFVHSSLSIESFILMENFVTDDPFQDLFCYIETTTQLGWEFWMLSMECVNGTNTSKGSCI